MKRKLGVFLSLSLLFTAAAVAQTAPSSAKDYFDQATVLMNEGKFAQAVTALRSAVRLEPNRYELWANLGNAYFASQKYAEAEQVFQKASEMNAPEAAAHFNLCRTMAVLKKTGLAVAPCREAIRLDANQEIYHVALAEIYISGQQPAETLRLLSGATENFETSVPIAGYSGDLYFQDGDLARRRKLRTNHLTHGNLLRKMGRREEALQVYLKVIPHCAQRCAPEFTISFALRPARR